MNDFAIKFEEAVRLICEYLPQASRDEKSTLFHSIRVGMYLYERNYPEEVIIAGLLHDVIEDSEIEEKVILEKYGQDMLDIVKANSKNSKISDIEERIVDMINRCIMCGEEALIVKAADVMDNYRFNLKNNLRSRLGYCIRNIEQIILLKPENFDDKIFVELSELREVIQ